MHLAIRHQRLRLRPWQGRLPARRLPVLGGRHRVAKRACDHEHEVAGGEHEESVKPHPDRRSQWRSVSSAGPARGAPIIAPAAETAWMAMPASGAVAAVREPLNKALKPERYNPVRSPRPPMIPEPAPHQPQLAPDDGETGNNQSSAPSTERRRCRSLVGGRRAPASHPSAEAVPRKTKNSVNIHPIREICQSQVVVVMVAKKPRSFGHRAAW